MAQIPGGFILLARRLLTSDIWRAPLLYRVLYLILLLKAEHREVRAHGQVLARGQLVTTYEELRDACTWFAGNRPIRPQKHDIANALRALRDYNMITTAKTTRGLVVTIAHYDTYQTPGNYEYNSENEVGTTRVQQTTSTVDKNTRSTRRKKKDNVLARTCEKTQSSPPCPAALSSCLLYKELKQYRRPDGQLSPQGKGVLELWRGWDDFLAAANEGYPGCDVLAEVRKAHAWEVANRTRRKVKKIVFLNKWLARAQDRARSEGGQGDGDGFTT